jgi:hypothetical protein
MFVPPLELTPMRFVFFVLLILLIAQVGFWHTLGAVLGAALMFILAIPLDPGGVGDRRGAYSGWSALAEDLGATSRPDCRRHVFCYKARDFRRIP